MELGLIGFLLYAGSVVSNDISCDLLEYRDIVSYTESRIIERVEFRVPSGFFAPGRMYGCALMAFDISEDGSVKNIGTIISVPTRAIAANARHALAGYRFDHSPGKSYPHGALIFEAIGCDDC